MKKLLCLALILSLTAACAAAMAAPQLSDGLFSCAKQAVGYLASGEYERLVTLLPFSGIAPSAAEWERFARNYAQLGGAQQDYAVAYWKDDGWRVAVPVQAPSNGGVEALVLLSEDGSSFTGYRYATWSQIEKECAASDHVAWNREYVPAEPQVFAD